ncbi:MAG: hypothetical protein HYR85_18290 [Planctomycetes bacterium]|nr:hypothetical protein [Planctomycetota bacterium]
MRFNSVVKSLEKWGLGGGEGFAEVAIGVVEVRRQSAEWAVFAFPIEVGPEATE